MRSVLAILVLAASLSAQDDKKEEAKKKDDEAKAKIAEFKKELKTAKTAADQAKALEILGGMDHPKILDELKGYLKSPSADIAIAAAEQIGKLSKNKDAAETLVATAGARRDKESIVKCLRYAGDVGVRSIVPKLTGFFKHKETDVAKEAVDSCAKLKAGAAIDPLLGLWRELDQIKDEKDQGGVGGGLGGGLGGNLTGTNTLQDESKKRKSDLTPAVESALDKITGESFKNLREANDWWRKYKGSWKEPAE